MPFYFRYSTVAHLILAGLFVLGSINGAPLFADERDRSSGIFGLQVGLVKAMGDIQTELGLTPQSTTGNGAGGTASLGAFAAYEFDTFMIRGGFDYFRLPEKQASGTASGYTWTYQTRLNDLAIRLDYLRFFNSRLRGAYLIGGLTYNFWEETLDAQRPVDQWMGVVPTHFNDRASWSKLGVDLGIGYRFTDRQSLELNYRSSKVGNSPFDSNARTLHLIYSLRVGH